MANPLYRLKYIENNDIRYGAFAKLSLILHRLDQLLEQGMYCIVVDDRDVEYKAPRATPAPAAPSQPLSISAIVAHMKKPENVARREKAKLNDAAMWAKLRNS